LTVCVLAVDLAALPLAVVGVVLVALGGLHLLRTDSVFEFYRRFNEGKGLFQLPGGASQRATRLLGWALIAIGVMAFIGAFT
jgi:hypothetical protein